MDRGKLKADSTKSNDGLCKPFDPGNILYTVASEADILNAEFAKGDFEIAILYNIADSELGHWYNTSHAQSLSTLKVRVV